ncbi:MAG: nitrophenyl compound nitroreductase subunit ArsF family protein [Candidatus Kryptoniota bacterium]
MHFHGAHQCYSCITVGQYAEENVNTYFAKEVAEGRLSFAHINAELPENQKKAAMYGVTGSSLWIGVYDDNGFHKEENVNVWYKINNKEEYMTYLRCVIQKRLEGDYS